MFGSSARATAPVSAATKVTLYLDLDTLPALEDLVSAATRAEVERFDARYRRRSEHRRLITLSVLADQCGMADQSRALQMLAYQHKNAKA